MQARLLMVYTDMFVPISFLIILHLPSRREGGESAQARPVGTRFSRHLGCFAQHWGRHQRVIGRTLSARRSRADHPSRRGCAARAAHARPRPAVGRTLASFCNDSAADVLGVKAGGAVLSSLLG